MKNNPNPSLILPMPGKNNQCVKKYLVQMRKIPAPLVSEVIRQGKVYEDQHKRCIFVSHDPDGNPMGAYIRGTYHVLDKIVNSAKGHDGTWGWRIGDLEYRAKLIVVESPIDAMSYKVLFNPKAIILAIGGLNLKCLKTVAAWLQPEYITVAVDNDPAGVQFRQTCAKLFLDAAVEHQVPKYKDWNEDLIMGGLLA